MKPHLVCKSAQDDTRGGGDASQGAAHAREAEAWGAGLSWTQSLSMNGPASVMLAPVIHRHTYSVFNIQH